jgi:hypothetical protein
MTSDQTPGTSGIDLKVERVRARVSAVRLANEMGVARQRISQVEALAVVNDEMASRYREALLSVTDGAQKPVEAA